MNQAVGSVSGKVAVVTGGARRVGRAVAMRLAEAGMDIAITYRRSGNEARQTVKEIEALGRAALCIEVDLADGEAVEHIHDSVVDRFGRVDALINNAAVFVPTDFGAITADDLSMHFLINAQAPLLLIKQFAPLLGAASGEADGVGRVVNLIDAHTLRKPIRGYLAYNLSKAALLEVTMGCAVELAPRITVNAVAPGVVAWAESFNDQQRQRYLERVPLGREGTPQDAAAAVLYLVRDAPYLTGQIIRVDGGWGLV